MDRTSTAALAAILGSRNGKYDNWENGTLAIGLDAGILGTRHAGSRGVNELRALCR